jgi:hypothetical protein
MRWMLLVYLVGLVVIAVCALAVVWAYVVTALAFAAGGEWLWLVVWSYPLVIALIAVWSLLLPRVIQFRRRGRH